MRAKQYAGHKGLWWGVQDASKYNRNGRTLDGRSTAFAHASLERLHDPAHPLAIFKPGPIALQHLDSFNLLKADFAFLDKTLVDHFSCRRHHLTRDVCPRPAHFFFIAC
jgi:hypothetical protein